jgi:hypothetical protein
MRQRYPTSISKDPEQTLHAVQKGDDGTNGHSRPSIWLTCARPSIVRAIILSRASDAARQTLEAMMSTTEWKDEFIGSYVQLDLWFDRALTADTAAHVFADPRSD